MLHRLARDVSGPPAWSRRIYPTWLRTVVETLVCFLVIFFSYLGSSLTCFLIRVVYQFVVIIFDSTLGCVLGVVQKISHDQTDDGKDIGV